MERIDILVSSRDRATEVMTLMQSLRTQTFQDWDLYILDNASGTPLLSFPFINAMINRLKLENHKVKILRQDIDFGICYARNFLNEIQQQEGRGNFCLRLDDDVIPQHDYIEKLFYVIHEGYDIASGLTPPIYFPEHVRDIKFLKGMINKVGLNKEGDLIEFGDDCGFCYSQKVIIPAGHFRSCMLYKKEIGKIKYPDNLSKYGFREESFLSLKGVMKGYKIGVHTGAIVYHLQTQSGGGKSYPNINEMIQNDDLIFRKWVKKKYLDGELNGKTI